jgi:hypothetical protein
MFFSKKTTSFQTNVFFLTPTVESAATLVAKLVSSLDDTRINEKAEFEINFGKKHFSLDRLKTVLGAREVSHIEQLMITTPAGENNRSSFDQSSIVLVLAKLPSAIYIAWRTDGEVPQPQLEEVFSRMKEWAAVHCAYCRHLRSDYAIVSESKVKESVFGTKSVSAPALNERWLLNPLNFREASIRGIYPTNYWSDEAKIALRQKGVWLPEVAGAASGIYRFSEGQQAEIVARNPTFREYIHFGDTD